MKNGFMLFLAAAVFVGCGSPEPPTGNATEGAGASAIETQAAPEKVAESAGGPCSALDVDWVRYDAAGKPVAYTFEYPSGWEINELFSSGATSIDVTKSLGENRFPDFVLRFGHVVDKPMDNPENLVATWKKMPMIEEVLEVDVEGRTMWVARSRIGEMIGFQALFPDVSSESKAWMVSGGVSDAPDGCEDAAVAAVERVIRSFKPNPAIGAPPEK